MPSAVLPTSSSIFGPTAPSISGTSGASIGPGLKKGCRRVKLVVLADVLEPFAGAEGVEDGAQRADVLAHAGGRGEPARRIAILDVLLDLRAHAELEAAARHLLQVPARQRDVHRTARENDQHRGADLEFRGRRKRLTGEQQAVMDGVGHEQAVVAHGLDATGEGAHVGQVQVFRG